MRKYICIIFIVHMVIVCAFSSGNGERKKVQEEHQPLISGTTGPMGNAPTDHQEIQLNDIDITTAQDANYKIAVLMHTSSDFTNAILLGVRETAESVGANVILVTDAEFNENKQKLDIEDAITRDPDIIITLVLDTVSSAVALQPAVDKGVSIALLSNLPQGFVHKQHYASVVTDDLFDMGRSLAELMNEQLSENGNIALMFHDADYYVTNQRDRAVKTVLAQNYSKLEIVAERGIANPFDGEMIASQLLTDFPRLDAIYTPWDSIAEGVLTAVRTSGSDIRVFTMDLGVTTALDMAQGGNMSGIVAELPFEIGVVLTKIGILDKLGKDTPPFVTVPGVKVTAQNLEEIWEQSLKKELPVEIKNVLQ